jgi:phage shock protein A
MGILSRLSYTVRAWFNALVNRASDPSRELDYSYEQLRDELQDVKRGIADLTTQKKRLQKHRDRLQANVEKHNEQAREAVRQDRDDLARRALEKKQANLQQIEDLDDQVADLEQTQETLVAKKDELQNQIEQFRTKKETMKARYEAAEASVRVSEALTGAGEEMGDVSRTIERATERTDEMEARAAALEELEESGALENVLAEGDSIDRELDRIAGEREVDSELETIRRELGKAEGETTVEVDAEAVEAELAELEADESKDED